MTTNDLTEDEAVFHVHASELDHIERTSNRFSVVHYADGSAIGVDTLLTRIHVDQES